MEELSVISINPNNTEGLKKTISSVVRKSCFDDMEYIAYRNIDVIVSNCYNNDISSNIQKCSRESRRYGKDYVNYLVFLTKYICKYRKKVVPLYKEKGKSLN